MSPRMDVPQYLACASRGVFDGFAPCHFRSDLAGLSSPHVGTVPNKLANVMYLIAEIWLQAPYLA